jgi:hypothetical protein
VRALLLLAVTSLLLTGCTVKVYEGPIVYRAYPAPAYRVYYPSYYYPRYR